MLFTTTPIGAVICIMSKNNGNVNPSGETPSTAGMAFRLNFGISEKVLVVLLTLTFSFMSGVVYGTNQNPGERSSGQPPHASDPCTTKLK